MLNGRVEKEGQTRKARLEGRPRRLVRVCRRLLPASAHELKKNVVGKLKPIPSACTVCFW